VSRQLQIIAWAVPALAVPTIGRADFGGTGARTLDTRFSMGAGATRSSGRPVYYSLNRQALQLITDSPVAISEGRLAGSGRGAAQSVRRRPTFPCY
jgi:hypothetical protein